MSEQQTDLHFCQFRNMRWGLRAGIMLLRKYYNLYQLKTIREIISRWAPPSDGNNTEGYIKQVCLSADVMPDDALPDMDEHPYKWIAVVRAMCEVECGHQYLDCIPENDYIIGWHLMELATGARR